MEGGFPIERSASCGPKIQSRIDTALGLSSPMSHAPYYHEAVIDTNSNPGYINCLTKGGLG